jgi:hypothetical protein
MAAIHDPREPRMPARSRGDRAYVAIRVELASLGTAHTAGDPQWGPAPGSDDASMPASFIRPNDAKSHVFRRGQRQRRPRATVRVQLGHQQNPRPTRDGGCLVSERGNFGVTARFANPTLRQDLFQEALGTYCAQDTARCLCQTAFPLVGKHLEIVGLTGLELANRLRRQGRTVGDYPGQSGIH